MIARLCVFLCVLTIFATFQQPVSASEPRVALVIGNSDYGPAIGKLKNPVNDAKLMAATLKGLGFSVDLVLDADQRTMKRAVKAFGAKLREAGQDATGFFYYAGHGVQVEGTNYLLPVGADIEAEADVDIESVSADGVMTQIQSAGNAVNLVFFDACRNNPLARTSRSATRGLARLDAPRGSFVGYSTAPGDVAADGDGANSPYAFALAEELKKPGISIEEAHRNVRAKVLAETGEKQTPWDSSSLTGPVVLEPKVEAPAPQPVAQPAPQPQIQQQASVDKEALFWESIKESKDPAEYQAYLKKYPDGTFADLAKAKIANLSAPPSTQQASVIPASAAPLAEDETDQVSPTADGTIVLSKSVGAKLQDYLKQSKIKTSYFYASLDGKSGGSFICSQTCGTALGVGNQAAIAIEAQKRAKADCEKTAKTECVMLLSKDEKQRAYTMFGLQTSDAPAATQPASAAQPQSQSVQQAAVTPPAGNPDSGNAAHVSPLPDGTIVLTKAVAAELEKYRHKSMTYGYFFVSLDGMSSGAASCTTDYSACKSLVQGEFSNPSDQARLVRKRAVSLCEATAKAECVMLFHLDDEKRKYQVSE